MPSADPDFESNVFINCPFDADYEPLKKALLYTVVALGYKPRISTERADAAEQRIVKICELIDESSFSIHDLSRIKASKEGEFYRLNMPFELGIDYGSRQFGRESHQNKQFLILSSRRYDYMKAVSDLNGIDIEAHSDDPAVLIRKVRNWFVTASGDTNLDAPANLWYDYGDFNADLYDKLKGLGFSDDDIKELPVVEYLDYVRRWLDAKMDEA